MVAVIGRRDQHSGLPAAVQGRFGRDGNGQRRHHERANGSLVWCYVLLLGRELAKRAAFSFRLGVYSMCVCNVITVVRLYNVITVVRLYNVITVVRLYKSRVVSAEVLTRT